jgi:hypothetical protein
MVRPRFLLEDPATFLHWLAGARSQGFVSLDDVEVAQVYSVAALAALARHDGVERLTLLPASGSGAARFAHAIGLQEVVEGSAEREPVEHERTVTLTRVLGRRAIESTSRRIADLLLPPGTSRDAAHLFWFVLVEMLRNVGQHSEDPAGGVVAAQRNDAGPCKSWSPTTASASSMLCDAAVPTSRTRPRRSCGRSSRTCPERSKRGTAAP